MQDTCKSECEQPVLTRKTESVNKEKVKKFD